MRLPKAPTKLHIDGAYDRASEKYKESRSVNEVDYDALVARLRSATLSRTVAGLSPRDLRYAANCLFDPRYSMAQDREFIEQYLGALRLLRNRMAIRRLIYNYCRYFDPVDSRIARLGQFLEEEVSKAGTHRLWSERQRLVGIFSPKRAPREIAEHTFATSSPREKLGEFGLTGPLAVEGLSAYVLLSALEVIQARLSRIPSLEDVDRAIAWGRLGGIETPFFKYRGAVANALLLPFIDVEPDQLLRLKIQNFLLDDLGDPRIDRSSWVTTDETARAVLIRWLAQATLEQFLRVVDRVAPRHQWDDRRAFWGAYVEKQVVSNAWVAFGVDGARVARQISESTSDTLMRRFASLREASSDHAVLLLSIGDLVVADWSHNGKLRVWRSGDRSAPQFGLPSYVANQLRVGPDFETPHLPPGGWQSRAEAYIRRHTGIRLSESEFLPR
ncbi:EH signature domain-containing protein [Bradyrhizobium sp. S3.3.6]|uniref:EH signature domain-containing protein n=1 Tax=Bradyrhizobium sp. S3.3.6 TaxID=3156429 RepID=UPI00339951F7